MTNPAPAVTPIDPATVVNTYNGGTGCACGCKGTYSDSGSTATRRVNYINKYLSEAVVWDFTGSTGERCYEIVSENQKRVVRVYVKVAA